jgi:hypothetical protein
MKVDLMMAGNLITGITGHDVTGRFKTSHRGAVQNQPV